MNQHHFSNLFLDQIKDRFWTVNSEFHLVYANQAYLNVMKEVTGVEKKLNESVFVERFGKERIDKWKAHYKRAFSGETFEIQEHFYDQRTNETRYSQIIFNPLFDEDGKTHSVACQSRDVTGVVQQMAESKLLMDASLDTFCTMNEAGDFVFVSAAAQDHWGYLPEELIGKASEDFIFEEDAQKTREIVQAILEGAGIRTFENRYIKKDGSIAYNLWSARWDGDAKLMYCVARDGKEKMEQDALILQSKQRFKALVQEGSDLIGILDQDGNYIYVSPTSTSILGIAPEAFIGRSAFEFIHPEDAEVVLESLRKITTEKKVNVAPFRFQNKKKEWRWVESVLTDMTDNPAVNGIVANSRDVTDKIAEEQKLQLFEKVINSTSDSIIITEAEPLNEPGPRIVYVNKAFSEHTGYPADEVIGKNPRFLQGPDSNQSDLRLLGEMLRRREAADITIINYKKSGEPFWVNFAVSPVADKNGLYSHFISVQRDVTEQKNRELEKDLFGQISQSFSNEEGLTRAAEQLCESIRGFGKFDIIELWCPNMEQNELQLIGQYSKGQEFDPLNTSIDSFKKGEGLPGEVWKRKKQVLWGEKEISKLFRRKESASKLGLKSVFGVPLTYKNDVVGVLLLGSTKDKSYLNKYSVILSRLEGFIGSEINRKRLEYDLKYLYNAIPEILCIADFKGRFLKVNTAGCDLLGLSMEEIVYHSFHEFVHPEDKKNTADEVNKLTNGSITLRFENRLITKEGKVVWLSWSCSSDISRRLIYGSAKDITEQKLLQELHDRASRLSKIGAWEVDLEQSTVYWSDMVHLLHETDPNEYVPDLVSALNFYREDYRSIVERGFENCIRTGIDFYFEAVIITKGLKERWIRAHCSLEKLNGKPRRLYGSFQDITESKESEIRLDSLANNLPGVAFQYVIHPDGTDALHYVTKGALKTWGFLPDEVMANNNLVWNQIELGGDLEAVKDSIADSITNKTTWNAYWRYVMPNKEVAVHVGFGTPTFLADGRIVFHSVILDVTQESKSEELLLQASNMAMIGSWELDLIHQDGDAMYWSPMTKKILECEESYNPSLTGGFEFCTEKSKDLLQKAVDELIHTGKEFDYELLVITAKGNERWVRCIGKREFIDGECTKIHGSYQDIHEQKLTTLELEKSLKAVKDYKYSLDQSAIVAFTDQHGIITFVNDNFCKISKYPREEIIGKTHQLINSKHHPASFFKNLWKTIASGKVWRGEIKNKAKDGCYYWVDTTIVPFLDEKNNPIQYLAIRFDITDRKKAEQEKTNLLETLENSLNEIYIFDSETFKFKYVNKGALLNLGYSDQEIKALTPLDIKPDYTLTSFKELVAPLMSNEKQKIIFFTNHQRKDGSQYPVEVHLQLVIEGNDNRFLAIILDITERKKAEENILQANERFEKVTEATNDVIWDWDIASNELYLGGGFKSQFGYDPEKISSKIEKRIEQLHPDDRERVKKSLTQALNDSTTNYWSEEFRYRKSDNTYVYVMDKGVIIRGVDSKPMRVVGAMTDLTKQKRTEIELMDLNESLEKYALELERSNKELEQFAFVTSHDLQEPLRMITSFMDLLKRNYGDQLDSKAHQYIHLATDGAKRMKQIILDLLLYSRANKPEEGLEEVDLNETLSDFRQLRKNVIVDKSVVIHSDQLPSLKTHRAPITQVFHGILDNAIKYAKSDVSPIIEITVKEKRDEWEFSIKDNGIGINEEFFEKIFGIFKRLHNRERYEGTGIGLSVAKRSVEFLGGTIWLTSALGKGSTFYFTIKKQQVISEQYER